MRVEMVRTMARVMIKINSLASTKPCSTRDHRSLELTQCPASNPSSNSMTQTRIWYPSSRNRI